MTKFKAVIKQVRLNGGEWIEYTEPKFEKMDMSKIKGGKGDEESIKKNRCSTRMTSEEALKIEFENGSIIESPELKGDVVRGKGRWLFPNEEEGL